MSSLLGSLFGSARRQSLDSQASDPPSRHSIGSLPAVASFNDFSLGCLTAADDFECEKTVGFNTPDVPTTPPAPVYSPARADVWQSTFNPGMNANMKNGPRSSYDHCPSTSPSVWAHIAKSDAIKQLSFNNLDKNKDGFIDAAELRSELGSGVDVEALLKKTGKRNDGKIDYTEFCELLRDS